MGLKIACQKGWVSKTELAKQAELLANTSYGQYLLKIMDSLFGD